MHINTAGLLALDAAVSGTVEQNGLPMYAAAFDVIYDIETITKQVDSRSIWQHYVRRYMMLEKFAHIKIKPWLL